MVIAAREVQQGEHVRGQDGVTVAQVGGERRALGAAFDLVRLLCERGPTELTGLRGDLEKLAACLSEAPLACNITGASIPRRAGRPAACVP